MIRRSDEIKERKKNKEVTECKKDVKYRRRINDGKEISLECSVRA